MSWKPVKYIWQWQLKSSPAELWPYVADTQRFNLATRLPAIHFKEIPLEIGGSRRMAKTSKLGISVTYEDYPFEWIKEQEFSNLRIFESGPLSRTFARLTLEPNEAGTLLNYYVEVTPANLLGFFWAFPINLAGKCAATLSASFGKLMRAYKIRLSSPFPLKATP